MIVKVELWAFREGEVREVKIHKDAMHLIEICEDTNESKVMWTLEEVFFWGQNDHQPKEQPSVSVGDIALLNGKRYLCESVGWRELIPEEYLAYTEQPRHERVLSLLR